MQFTKCKNCPDRTVEPNCHMSCPDYLNFKKEKEKFNNEKLNRISLYSDNYMKKARNKKFNEV